MVDVIKIKVELSAWQWHQVLQELNSGTYTYGGFGIGPNACKNLLLAIANQLSDVTLVFAEPPKPKEEAKPEEKKSWKDMPWYKRWWRK